MKTDNIIYSILLILFVSSCGVPQSDYDKLKAENEGLITELDECKFGAEKIAASVEKAYADQNYALTRSNIQTLAEKHPESPRNEEFKELLVKIKEEEKEQFRLANLDNTGMWSIRHYVDDFGEATKEGYITNTNTIRGTFSNTATQDAKLDVRFLISDASDISIKLFEYAGNNPVKAPSYESYTVLVQDKEGNRLKLKAVNRSDRLSFDKKDSNQLHDALMKGGTLLFKITENDTPTTQYQFTIQKADLYENAHRMLNES